MQNVKLQKSPDAARSLGASDQNLAAQHGASKNSLEGNAAPSPGDKLNIALNEIERIHTALCIIKQMLKGGRPTAAYVEVCQALEGIPHAFR